MKRSFLLATLISVITTFHNPCSARSAALPETKEFTNSIGMKFVRIEPGTFRMGNLAESLPFDMMP